MFSVAYSLRYSKNGFLTIAGFSKPQDATEDDLRLWLPLVDDPPADLEVETCEFIVTHVGDQFCDLVEQEREAQAMHLSEGNGYFPHFYCTVHDNSHLIGAVEVCPCTTGLHDTV